MKTTVVPHGHSQKFWFVWHEAHGLPRHKHQSMNEAFKEAERLARENRGKHFHVLEWRATCATDDVSWVRDEGLDDGIPF